MVAYFVKKLGSRHRKYPIKRDESGKSARCRTFQLFDQGLRPSAVAPRVGISARTACRYFQDWKRQPSCLEVRYRVLRAALKNRRIPASDLVQSLAVILGITSEQILEKLEKPWAIRQLLSGQWLAMEERGISRRTLERLDAALDILRIYEVQGISPQRIVEELDRLQGAERKKEG
jgi:AraC-like DNA-binding protein